MADPVKPLRTIDCSECAQLWDEYTRATRAQLLLLEQMAVAGKDIDKLRELEPKLDAARTAREQAWERIRSHQVSIHGGIVAGEK